MHAASTDDGLSCHLTFALMGASELELAVDLLSEAASAAPEGRVGAGDLVDPDDTGRVCGTELSALARRLGCGDIETASRTRQLKQVAALNEPMRVFGQEATWRTYDGTQRLRPAPLVMWHLEEVEGCLLLRVGREVVSLPLAAREGVVLALRGPETGPETLSSSGLSVGDAVKICRILLLHGLLVPS
jgi:hypothetical protein